jgi:hypothetical protein
LSSRNLNEALKSCLEEPHKVSVYEAKVIRELILADGTISTQEKALLEEALHKDEFDDKAYRILSELIARAR